MKPSHLILITILLAAIPAFAQQRPRYSDNIDRTGGVRVKKPEPTPTPTVASKHYVPSPSRYGDSQKNMSAARPAAGKLVKKTVQVTMSVSEGFAQRELPRVSERERPIMAAGKHLKGFSTGNELVDSYIVESSRRYNIDPLLIYAQMSQESAFKPRATSYKGASGLMQLMPATARRLGVTNIYDPRQNIEGGVKYMRILLDMFWGDINLALAGYNAGEGAVIKYGRQIPPYRETQDYVSRISARYRSLSASVIAREVSPVGGSRFPASGQKDARPSNKYK